MLKKMRNSVGNGNETARAFGLEGTVVRAVTGSKKRVERGLLLRDNYYLKTAFVNPLEVRLTKSLASIFCKNPFSSAFFVRK